MSINLNITEHWVEEGKNGRIERRIMTLDEYLEEQCEVCLEAFQVFEISLKDHPETNEYILACKECAKIIVSEKMNDDDFSDTLQITRL